MPENNRITNRAPAQTTQKRVAEWYLEIHAYD